MYFKTIKGRTLAIILPIMLITLLAIIGFSYLYSKSLINKELDQKMQQQLNSITGNIQTDLVAHSKLTESLVKTIEASNPNDLSLVQYQQIMSRNLEANKETFGLGVFFAPYKYNSASEFFSTYAYSSGDQVLVTEEYNDPTYNYPTQEWFTNGEQTSKPFVYSDPYFDTTTSTLMVTASAPFKDSSGAFQGVITGDINLNTLQSFVSETKVGETGWSILLDSKGTYLATPNEKDISETSILNDQNPSLASIGKDIVSKESGFGTYTDQNGVNRIFYQKVPINNWTLALVIPEKELTKPLESLLQILMVISMVAVIVIVVVIILYSQYLSKNINRVNDLSVLMANGDFSHDIEVKSHDEFRTMADHLNKMLDNLRHMFKELNESTTQVAATSEELTATTVESTQSTTIVTSSINQITNGAESQVVAVEESTRAMEEIAVGMQKIAESTSSVSEVSMEVNKRADEGNMIIQSAIGQMNFINQTVTESNQSLKKLVERTSEIGTITDVITAITNQTNLLALNAAIEAARAGEAGKGFAVVAAEVRKLAEQSKNSADQITNLITEIQLETDKTSEAMLKGAEEVKTGNIMINQAGEVFINILENIKAVNEQLLEISAASEETSASSEQVSATTQQLLSIARGTLNHTKEVASSSDEQLKSVEDIASSAEGLSHLAENLQKLTSQFKI
jgi:methyl-accepting chemotaxis protein